MGMLHTKDFLLFRLKKFATGNTLPIGEKEYFAIVMMKQYLEDVALVGLKTVRVEMLYMGSNAVRLLQKKLELNIFSKQLVKNWHKNIRIGFRLCSSTSYRLLFGFWTLNSQF